jgi:acetyl-CoA acyltransferase
MSNVVITGYARTPFRFARKGKLTGVRPGRTNIDDGAIALGHPLGATRARVIGKAAQIMRRDGRRFALAAQCIGGGQGIAAILEAA